MAIRNLFTARAATVGVLVGAGACLPFGVEAAGFFLLSVLVSSLSGFALWRGIQMFAAAGKGERKALPWVAGTMLLSLVKLPLLWLVFASAARVSSAALGASAFALVLVYCSLIGWAASRPTGDPNDKN